MSPTPDGSKSAPMTPSPVEVKPTGPLHINKPRAPSLPTKVKHILEEKPESVVGSEIKIKGELSFEKLLRIDGVFEGKLISAGSVVIGPTGSVTGDLKGLSEVYCEGKICGNIVAEVVQIRKTAVVLGDVECWSLAMDPGVRGYFSFEAEPFADGISRCGSTIWSFLVPPLALRGDATNSLSLPLLSLPQTTFKGRSNTTPRARKKKSGDIPSVPPTAERQPSKDLAKLLGVTPLGSTSPVGGLPASEDSSKPMHFPNAPEETTATVPV
ncbi:unnamed protein product [Chrysoparadoxa australica]